MPKRLVIPVEFSSVKEDEIRLFVTLKSFSNAGAIIKDILKGKLDVSILEIEKESKNNG